MKKWIFRILITFSVLCGLVLFGLRISSGTSDTHKRGLEQAFSQISLGHATFGALKTFNLFPQFSIEVADLRITNLKGMGALSADHILISFGAFDLILKNRKIEAFHVQNLTVSQGVYTPLDFYIKDAGIYPDQNQDSAHFILAGAYGSEELKARFRMSMIRGVRPKYFFNQQNEFTMTVAGNEIQGLFHPYETGGAVMSHLEIRSQKKKTSMKCLLPPEKVISISIFFGHIFADHESIRSEGDFNQFCESLKK